MIRYVLIPLDGSQFAEKALPIARQVLETGGHITLMTALPGQSSQIYYPTDETMDEVEDHTEVLHAAKPQAQDYMERIAQKLRLQGYVVDIHIVVGDPAAAIVQTAEGLRTDMIVISTHGRSGLSRFLFGSVTLKVLSESAIPVLVVPSREREEAEEPAPASAPDTGPSLAI